MNRFKPKLRWYSSLLISGIYGATWLTEPTIRELLEALYLFTVMFGLCMLVWHLVVRFGEEPLFLPRQVILARRAVWTLGNNRSLLAAIVFMLLAYAPYAYLAEGSTTVQAWLSFQDEGILVTVLIRYINYTYDLLNYYQTIQLDNEQLLRANLNAQFEVLKQQVAPHFLFNSLNTLKSLVRRQDPLAESYVQNLSAVYRYLLQQRTSDVATLTDELRFLDAYVYLQQIRFGHGFNLRVDVPAEFRATLIPPITLQILVENALKHNVVSPSRPLQIDIEVIQAHLTVRNNRQAKLTQEPSTGVGLDNINNRYLHLTGQSIDIQDEPAYFSVSLPVIFPTHERIANRR